jgi:hypothetical protein
MPAERWPRAARERSASLRARAPPLLRPFESALAKGALSEQGENVVT